LTPFRSYRVQRLAEYIKFDFSKSLKRVLLFIFILSRTLPGWCQAVPDTSMKQPIPDSAKAEVKKVQGLRNDSRGVLHKPEPWQPNPKKAGLYSAILPGSGQLYNKQYWKIPVIYVGVGAAVYFLKFNTEKYQTYRKAYIARLENKPDEYAGIYTTAALKQLQDGYKRYLDMTMLFTGLGYTLQVIDAVVFAHLRNFDVSKDISYHVQPFVAPDVAGLSLVVKF
jgi:hypothetical protein